MQRTTPNDLHKIMSRIYFHSQHGEAEISGSERAYMGQLCNNLALAVLQPYVSHWGRRPPPILQLVPTSSYLHTLPPEGPGSGLVFANRFHTWFLASMSDNLIVDGQPVPTFDLALNTAVRIGSDPIRLLARLHAQCEIHCWVDGPNRGWLADLIERGQREVIMRSGMGWENVVDLLRSRSDAPVVCSYSVCDQFPNAHAARWQPPEIDGELDWDAWYNLPRDEQWRQAMDGLRHEPTLEIRPDYWTDYYFGRGVDALQVARHLDSLADNAVLVIALAKP